MNGDYRKFTAAIGQRAKRLRLERGLSQIRVSQQHRISLSVLHNVESGERIGLRSLFRLAKAYGVEPWELLKVEAPAKGKRKPDA